MISLTTRNVVEDARRAGEVIQRLGDLVRPRRNGLEQVDLNETVTAVHNLLHSQLVMKQVEVSIDLDPQLPALSGIAVQLQQVLLNLLTNAIDAMEQVDPDRRFLHIRTNCTENNGIQLTVKDSGCGFGREPQIRIQAGLQGVVPRTRDGGLNLTITWTEGPISILGIECKTGLQGATRAANGIALIYVVDDDPSVRRSLTRLLKAAGFKVRAFASGNEFLEYGKPTENDCVVADVHMPGLNGLELQQALLADGICVPVILMTGRDDQGVRTAARSSGAAGFFTKPFDDQALIDTIKFAMKSSAAR